MYTLHYQAHNYVFAHCHKVSSTILGIKYMPVETIYFFLTYHTEPALLIELYGRTHSKINL